jgi:hypothetical protein
MQTEHSTRIVEAHSAICDQVLVRGRYRRFLLIASKTGCDKPPIQWLREVFLLEDQSKHQILKISKELPENIQRYCKILSVLVPECNVAMGVEAVFLTNVLSNTALNFNFLIGFQLQSINMPCSPPSTYYSDDQYACDGRCMWHARRLRCIMVFMGKPEGSRPL